MSLIAWSIDKIIGNERIYRMAVQHRLHVSRACEKFLIGPVKRIRQSLLLVAISQSTRFVGIPVGVF